MKNEGWIYVAAAVLCLGWMLAPAPTHAAKNHGFNISIRGDATSCADLRVTSSGGLAQVNQVFTLSKGEAPILEMNAADHGQIHVRAWDHADYSVEACKIAAAETRAEADQIVRGISVNHTAGNLSYNGPTTESGDWTVVFFIHAPKDAALNLETRNGPIEVNGVNGSVKLRATNGPIAVSDCGGRVDARTQNGPIAFHGDRGDVHLIADNGPIALHLSSEAWNGAALEARTINGPLAIHMPDTFRSGIRLETSGHVPMACHAAACRNAWSDSATGGRVMQMNGGSEAIRISTENGPVAIHGGKL